MKNSLRRVKLSDFVLGWLGYFALVVISGIGWLSLLTKLM